MKTIYSLILGVMMTGISLADSGENLSNGGRFKSVPRSHTQTVSIVMLIKGGLFRETPDTNGVGALFARTWIKSGSLLEQAEYIGGHTDATLGGDYFEFVLSVPSANLDSLLPELRRQVLAPSFSASAFEREKSLALQEIEAEKDDPNTLAFQLYMQATYKNHPYALKNNGDAASVAKLTLEDIKSYYKNHFYGADMIVALAGKYTKEQEAEIKKIFSAVPKGDKISIICENAGIETTERTFATDGRIQQAKLFLSYPAPAASSPDYMYTKILSDLLGGGMSSPYFTALRKEKGYAYAVGTMYPSNLCTSRLTGFIGLQPENIEDAIMTMQQINGSILQAVSEEEVEKAKNHIIGQLLSEVERNSRTAWYAAFFENLGMGFDYIEKYIENLRKVKKEDLADSAAIFKKPYTVFIYAPAEKLKGD